MAKRRYNNARRKAAAESRALKKNLEMKRRLELEALDINDENIDPELMHTLAQRLERQRWARNGMTRNEHNKLLRIRLLDRFVKDRICPSCGKGPFIKTNEWMYNAKRKPYPMICKSCVWQLSRLGALKKDILKSKDMPDV